MKCTNVKICLCFLAPRCRITCGMLWKGRGFLHRPFHSRSRLCLPHSGLWLLLPWGPTGACAGETADWGGCSYLPQPMLGPVGQGSLETLSNTQSCF